jgi:hypothetical protein
MRFHPGQSVVYQRRHGVKLQYVLRCRPAMFVEYCPVQPHLCLIQVEDVRGTRRQWVRVDALVME